MTPPAARSPKATSPATPSPLSAEGGNSSAEEATTNADAEWPLAPEYQELLSHPQERQGIRRNRLKLRPRPYVSRRLGVGLGVCALALLLAFVAGAWSLSRSDGRRPASSRQQGVSAGALVPKVAGMSSEVARRTLEVRGFRVRMRRVDSSRPVGLVLQQDPGPGRRLTAAGTVLLVVAASSAEKANPASAPNAIPHVVGLRLAQARSILESAGFGVRISNAFSSRPAGEVIEQTPVSGSPGTRNQVIDLSLSRGPDQVTVPRVVGLEVSEATSALRAAELRPTFRLIGSTRPAGTVLRQSPAAHAKAERGSVVLLHVAKKPPAPTVAPAAQAKASDAPATQAKASDTPGAQAKVLVPRLVGNSSEDAQSRLRELGLRSVLNEVTAEQPSGIIVKQAPTAGTQVAKGQTIMLDVSTGPPTQLTVPDVRGLHEQTAVEQLEATGFQVVLIDEPTTEPQQDGIVIQQQPMETTGTEGETVTLTIGRLS